MMDYTTDTDDPLLDRWPWVENKADILSGEAGMVANPGGTFMYTVWNQWQELEEDVITNSDIWFRRLMYLPDDRPDGTPSTRAIQVSDDLQLVGASRSSSLRSSK